FSALEDQFQVAPAEVAAQPVNTDSQPGLASAAPLAVSPAGLQSHPFVQLFDAGAGVANAPVSRAAAAKPPSILAMAQVGPGPAPDYQVMWDERFGFLQRDNFALLDVSSNANQMGVSFAWFGDRQ